MKKLQVWWMPQVPGEIFTVEVETPLEGAKILNILAEYDLFQFDNNIKPDYANTGGLTEWDEEIGDWVDWYDEEIGWDPLELLNQ